jgi:hypothetical protein
VRDLEVGVQDLEVGGRLDVTCSDDARSLLGDVHLDLGRRAVEADDEVLQIEDDVRHVLAHSGKRRELVRDALDLHRGDRGALERRQQHTTKRVSERVTEAAVERLDPEHAAMVVGVLVDDLRNLEVHQASSYCHVSPFLRASRARQASPLLLGIQLHDQ